VLTLIPAGGRLTLLAGGPVIKDGLTWWPVRQAAVGAPQQGWMAQVGPTGEVFLASTAYVM